MLQEATHPHWEVCGLELQRYRLSRNHEVQVCARKAYFARKKKKSERKEEFPPVDPTPQRAGNLGNQSASYLLLLHQERGLQREKKKKKQTTTRKSTVDLSLCWKALRTSAGTQSLNFSIHPLPYASTCLSSYTPSIPTRRVSVLFLPPVGPVSSFSL